VSKVGSLLDAGRARRRAGRLSPPPRNVRRPAGIRARRRGAREWGKRGASRPRELPAKGLPSVGNHSPVPRSLRGSFSS